MIRQYNEGDVDAVMQIWLDTNIQAHNFISSDYWRINSKMVREMLPHAEVYEKGKEGLRVNYQFDVSTNRAF